MKVYFVYGNDHNYDRASRIDLLENLGSELEIENVALTFVPSFLDRKSEVYHNKINREAKNTFIIYRHRAIIDKFINLLPTEQNFALISDALDRTKSKFFDLDEPRYNRE